MEERTYSLSFRYSDEIDFRPYSCGVYPTEVPDHAYFLASLTGVEDIKITIDSPFTDFKIYTI